ncbi:Lrp/AsnC family transcriptional regulator [Chloroflexota bacterium]
MKRPMIDSLDKKLITLLEQDARQSIERLANQLGVSPSTISRRIEKLVKNNVIRIMARPEPTKINLPLSVIVAFDIAHDKLNSVTKILSSRQEVRWLAVTSGRFDIFALMWFPSTEELFHFMQDEVGKLEGVRNTETFISLQVVKGL